MKLERRCSTDECGVVSFKHGTLVLLAAGSLHGVNKKHLQLVQPSVNLDQEQKRPVETRARSEKPLLLSEKFTARET